MIFFFKQKTAYEMRISDLSSDVCSSDLALRFGHLPQILVPAGPMPSGLANKEKQRVRQLYAEGKATRDELLEAEAASYHGAGTCTFYGTANSNQMMMELMGLHVPGSARSEEHTSELQSLMRISYAVFCLKKKKSITIFF